jgi:two-component system phosphate regulon sensor histidine kinase PhoR
VIIESPHQIVWDKMLFLLVVSLLIAIIIVYYFFWQIQIIVRHNRIAAVRQDFTHAMIHDMKNPITKIMMCTNSLKEGKLDEKIHIKNQYYELIQQAGNHLLTFTNKILAIAQFEDRTIQLSKHDMDLNELFGRLTKEYLVNPPKEIRFTVDCENMPVMHADPDYMVDVFKNLIDNAIKYSKGDTASIDIKGKKNNTDTIIKIKDAGMGISQQDRKLIFNKFERGGQRGKERKSGFGLGLYFVYQVILAHHGKITVESEQDVYSEFTITIPNKKR